MGIHDGPRVVWDSGRVEVQRCVKHHPCLQGAHCLEGDTEPQANSITRVLKQRLCGGFKSRGEEANSSALEGQRRFPSELTVGAGS